MDKNTSLIGFCKECKCEHLLESKIFICGKMNNIVQADVENFERDIETLSNGGTIPSERPYDNISLCNPKQPIEWVIRSLNGDSPAKYDQCKFFDLLEDIVAMDNHLL